MERTFKQTKDKIISVAKERFDEIEQKRPVNKILGALTLLAFSNASFMLAEKKSQEIEASIRHKLQATQSINAKQIAQHATFKVTKPAPLRKESHPVKLSAQEQRRADLIKTKENISKVNLTLPGYLDFLAKIDTSHLAYAQSFPEFNPNKVPIAQEKTKEFIWHYTFNPIPKGGGDIDRLIHSMAGRGEPKGRPDNHRCCAVNWAIGTDGVAYQLAPKDAKLRHDPPNDSIKTGVEVAAYSQSYVTTKQYETLAYLTVALTPTAVLNDQNALSQRAKGHGEDRDYWNAHHPKEQYDARDDFDAGPASWLRDKIFDFAGQNPILSTIKADIK